MAAWRRTRREPFARECRTRTDGFRTVALQCARRVVAACASTLSFGAAVFRRSGVHIGNVSGRIQRAVLNLGSPTATHAP
eukprot:6926063-Prymnesium_polylepis.2